MKKEIIKIKFIKSFIFLIFLLPMQSQSKELGNLSDYEKKYYFAKIDNEYSTNIVNQYLKGEIFKEDSNYTDEEMSLILYALYQKLIFIKHAVKTDYNFDNLKKLDSFKIFLQNSETKRDVLSIELQTFNNIVKITSKLNRNIHKYKVSLKTRIREYEKNQ
jgi:hypothetical protein